MTIYEWHRLMRDRLTEYKETMENRWDPDDQLDEEDLDVAFIEWLGYDVSQP